MAPKKKAANGYSFAEPLPKGTVLEDIAKKRWRLGPSIGKGGFGEIYSAQEESATGSKYPYVIKIEPHSNGPLFVEINFYIRHAKPVDVENFKKERGLKTFGMPLYYGSGSLKYKEETYRFLVMDKFSTDLLKLFLDNNKQFPVDTVFKIGLQLVDILEYIHLKGYVHADIKAANILLGSTKETENKQVYLVDFGLATKFTVDKTFKPNPKKAHDGTIEFLSRDAHHGVQTRRGDLEILAYNLIQWLGCLLPWENLGKTNDLAYTKLVQKSKEDHMSTVPKMIKACFGSKPQPKAIVEYLTYLKTMEFDSEPDYAKIRKIFTSGMKEGGGSMSRPLQFSPSKITLKRGGRRKSSSTTQTPVDADDLSEDNATAKKKAKLTNGTTKTTRGTARKQGGRKKPTAQETAADSDVDPSENQATTKEKAKLTDGVRKQGTRKKPVAQPKVLDAGDDMAGYTPEMRAIALRKQAKTTNGVARPRRKTPAGPEGDLDEDMDGYNEEMKALARSRKAKTKR